MLETVRGLVIRATDYGDNDRILTVLTASGKLTASAMGARGMKNRCYAISSPLCYSELVLEKKKDRFYLREGTLLENFFSIREDLERFSLASYLAQVADEICMENNDEEQMLSLLLNALFVLKQGKLPPDQVKAVFELRCADLSGFAPDLVACQTCGKGECEWMYLDVMNGTLVCEDCFGARENPEQPYELNGTAAILTPMERPVLEALRFIRYSEPKRVFLFRIEDEYLPRLSKICETYLLNHLEKGFGALDFYKEIQKLSK